MTVRTVEIFLKGERIAAHVRASGNHKHTTVSEHMPSSHRRYAGWTIERIRADARLIGPATAALCELILEARPHPEQGFRACLGIVRLAGPQAPSAWKPPPNAPSTSAPGPTARSNPSSTTTLTGVLRASAPRTERRSCTPTSVGRATTIRRDDLLKHPTLDQLNALGLHGMAKAFVEIVANGQADGLGHHEWLGLLLDREASWRQDKRFAARLRVAKLRQQASRRGCRLPKPPRSRPRAVPKLVEGEWINAHDNLVLVGPTGVGKSWLARTHHEKASAISRRVAGARCRGFRAPRRRSHSHIFTSGTVRT